MLITLDAALENGAYAWPGGYPLVFIMGDEEAICFDCLKANSEQIRNAKANNDKQWVLLAPHIHYEGDSIFCAHCNAEIESAYGPIDD